jgi:hypothetical protein
MLRKTLGTIIGGVLALALIGFVPQARADETNQLTKLTFNQPVRIPHNMLLPAGTYWFRVLDLNDSQTVQVLNANQTEVLATLETVATDRAGNTVVSPKIGDSQLTVARLPNQPPMLISWVYPGMVQGHEFTYSAQRENQLTESGHTMTVNVPNGETVPVG